jgi:Protein of unknown function (DUF3352)
LNGSDKAGTRTLAGSGARGYAAAMRARLLAGLAALGVAAALVGCASLGSGGSASGPSSAALTELSYFPAQAPFVATVATSGRSATTAALHRLQRRTPSIALAETALFGKLASLGIDYNHDIRPLFGNPITVGVTSSGGGGSTAASLLLAWVTQSATSLHALASKLPGVSASGTYDGASVYSGSHYAVAVDGATVLAAPSVSALDAALDRHAHSTGFTAAAYASATRGIDAGGAVVIVGDLSTVISGSKAPSARLIPWIAALRGYGMSFGGRAWRFHLDTSGAQLSTAQLPIAAGGEAPAVAGSLPVQFTLRDPLQTFLFAASVERILKPAGYAKLLADESTLARATGLSATTLLAMLSGPLQIEERGSGQALARLKVSDPATAASALSKLAAVGHAGSLPAGYRVSSVGDGFYRVAHGKGPELVGLIGDELVFGAGATTEALRAFAQAPDRAVSGASGSVAFRIAFGDLLRASLARAPQSRMLAPVLGQLGDITGWVRATTEGISGEATIHRR